MAVLSAGHVEDVRPQTPDEENSDALAAHVRSRNHPDATLDEKGFAQYCSDTDSDREDRAATPKAVKNAMDEAKRRVPSTRKVNGKELSEDITITDISGNSGTATKLKNSRKIGGVSFDGSGDISLPGVNTQGNQNTTGNAGSATKLQNARKINGVAFDGTKDITISAGMTQAAADARYVQNEQYTNETFHNPGGNEISWTFRAPAGCVLSGINVQETGSHSADNIGGVYYKAKQIYINGAWRTISG
ncbi:tail fiber protein [Escherichia coli]|uniref:tail fiber protein n=1 Tax=Escherichia coli TaxID=562 RepID=UPI00387E080A